MESGEAPTAARGPEVEREGTFLPRGDRHVGQPRVTIGVPVYNGERFIAAALDALLTQSFADIEVVISDNGSTDRTEEICRRYAQTDPRVRYDRTPENRGLAWNFNRVVELARGEYFKWAACDDLCAPTYVERCVQILDRNPDVVWCHSQTRYIDISGQLLATGTPLAFLDPGDGSTGAAIPWTRASARPYQRFYAVMTGPGEVYDLYGLMRTAALKRTQGFLPFYGADRVLLAELSFVGRYAEVPEPLFFARRHADQTVFRSQAKIERLTSGYQGRRLVVPRRIRMAWWMFRVAIEAKVGPLERLRCLAAFGLFVVNPKKWKRLAIDGLRAVGLRVRVPEDAVRQAAFLEGPAKTEERTPLGEIRQTPGENPIVMPR